MATKSPAKDAMKARKRFEKEERRKQAEAEAAAADAMERASAAAASAAASVAASQPGSPGRLKLAEATEGGDAGENAAAEGGSHEAAREAAVSDPIMTPANPAPDESDDGWPSAEEDE